MAIVKTSDFHQSFKELAKRLATRKVDLDKKHLVLVPDKCSIFAERILFSENSGAFDIEIVSFKRLFLLFCTDTATHLSATGAVMLVKKIIANIKKEFKVFKAASNTVGFASKIYETLCALSACNLLPADINPDILTDTQHDHNSTNPSALKLADIALMYHHYLTETKDRFVDTVGQMRLLLEVIQHTNLSNISLHVAGFDRFTRIEEEILNTLQSRCAAYTHYTVTAPQYIFGDVTFFEATDVASRVMAIAKAIKAEVVTGARYRDMCILATEDAYAPLERILTEFEIPFYIDKKMHVAHTELYRLLETLNACAKGFRRSDMITLAKNFYMGIQPNNSEIFENYCLKNAVNYKGFLEPFIKEDAKITQDNKPFNHEEKVAEQVRLTLMDTLNAYTVAFKRANSPEKFYSFIANLLTSLHAEKKTTMLSSAINLELTPVYNTFIETAELLQRIGVSEQVGNNPHALFTLYCEGLSSVSLSVMPFYSDTVMVGMPESFRGGKFKMVCAVDFVEGKLPMLTDDSGLINAIDIHHLSSRNVHFGPNARELNAYSVFETVRLFAGSEKLFLAYHETNGDKLSNLAHDVSAGASKYAKSSELERVEWLSNAKLEGAQLAKEISTYANARLMLTDVLLQQQLGKQISPYMATLTELLGEKVKETLIHKPIKINALLAEAGEAFASSGKVSISKMQTYFECPYKSFAQSVLGLRERDMGEVKPFDVGQFLHAAAENFIKEGDFVAPKIAMQKVTDALFSESQNNANKHYARLYVRNPALCRRIAAEAGRLATPIAETLTAGDFKNIGTEVSFGFSTNDSDIKYDLQGVTFTPSNGKTLHLQGVIDRIDSIQFKGKPFARVIDYKTGKTEYTYTQMLQDAYYGRLVQLPLYLKVLQANGLAAAGVFYFALSSGFGQEKYQLTGFYNSDNGILNAYDHALIDSPSSSQIVKVRRKKDGGLHAFSKPYAFNCGEFSHFTEYAYKATTQALEEIVSGYLTPNPTDKACQFCKFGGFCGFEKETDAVRVFEKITRSDVLGREVEHE